MPIQSDRPDWRRSLVLLAGACVAIAAQAGMVESQLDLLRVEGGQPTPPPGALDRALAIDLNSSQNNLDLLLEARRAGEGAGPMRAGSPSGQTPTLPGVQDRGNLVPFGLQAQDSVTVPGAAERREWQAGAPGQGQAAVPGGRSGQGGGGTDPLYAAQGTSGRGAGAGEPSRVAEVLGGLREFVRDNRFGLLAGAVLLVLAIGGLQVMVRRR